MRAGEELPVRGQVAHVVVGGRHQLFQVFVRALFGVALQKVQKALVAALVQLFEQPVHRARTQRSLRARVLRDDLERTVYVQQVEIDAQQVAAEGMYGAYVGGSYLGKLLFYVRAHVGVAVVGALYQLGAQLLLHLRGGLFGERDGEHLVEVAAPLHIVCKAADHHERLAAARRGGNYHPALLFYRRPLLGRSLIGHITPPFCALRPLLSRRRSPF